MNNIAIKAENLSKLYRVGQFVGYKTLRESLANAFSSRFHRLRARSKRAMDSNQIPMSYESSANFIWALKDISFEVKHGEVVGIIGRNGAGKTTLLKVLTRITEPTEGYAEIYGRVGSLLEVGTGFHQELTGRENIYLNGAVLGMKKAEIDRKFDEILSFAEVEKFIDTPIKRYSSGMQVRLAFSVAAHLEPEILLVDEVLAVGDVAFQKKCLGKMGDVTKEGRTVLFVSHNMEAIRRLCPKTMWIENGHIRLHGTSEDVISAYLSGGQEQTSGVRDYNSAGTPRDDYVHLRSIRLVNKAGDIASLFKINEGLAVEIEFTVLQLISNFHMYIRVFTQDGTIVFDSGDWDDGRMETSLLLEGQYLARCVIPGDLLNRGTYSLTIMGLIPDVRYVFVEENVLVWEISEFGGAGSSIGSHRKGIIRPRLIWSVSKFSAKGDYNRREIES